MYYEDLKYPLLQRGIAIPTAMEDYIASLKRHNDETFREEIEHCRQEMLQVFRDAGREVPDDFHATFDTWFLLLELQEGPE